MFLLDGGESLVKQMKGGGAKSARDRAKADLIASEWKALGLDAAAVGPTEWALLGRDAVMELVESGYPAVAADLVCDGKRPLPAAKVLERSGRKLGVVAITGAPVEGCVVTEPLHAIEQAVALLAPEDVDATVLLWPTRGEEAHSAALKGLGVDFVVDASGRYGKTGSLQRAGSSWLVGVGSMTKAVGVLGLTPGEGGYFFADHAKSLPVRRTDLERRLATAESAVGDDPTGVRKRLRDRLLADLESLKAEEGALASGAAGQMTFEIVTLDEKIADHPEVQARVEAVKGGFGMLPDASPAEILARRLEGPADSAYAGEAVCATCHPAEDAQWRKTGHSRAYTVLLKDRRNLDDACYSCHVTGAGTAVTSPEAAGGLVHVQCEACHGPARAHAADPAANKPVRDPDEATCRTCHDGERDQGQFDFATYRPKVVHTP
ncbi:MAG: hypothetical protein KC656_02375 [Myxococcales bacterium]|nr:hypothetical protein [Myxococcales bacterium]MCB9672438.1 hypothetical protein [Alphaproteobacteria bacterium]MCB9693055.1 hypothetical protein [Alphaproteobacteria bacterium]